MIEGFCVDVGSVEMKAHLEARAEHHRKRAAWYEEQRGQFADVPVAHTSNDPAKALQDAGKRHLSKASWFAFMAEHVPFGDTYRLSDHDLERLELVEAKGY